MSPLFLLVHRGRQHGSAWVSAGLSTGAENSPTIHSDHVQEANGQTHNSESQCAAQSIKDDCKCSCQ